MIVVPQSSKSNNALVVDLGQLLLSNKCELAGNKNKDGIPAVLDSMKIELTDLKIVRSVNLMTDLALGIKIWGGPEN